MLSERLTWQAGRVTTVAGGGVRIRLEALAQCQRCLSGEGCGAGVFSRLFAPRGAELSLHGHDQFRPGQAVRVGVRERDLVLAAGLLYGLPVVVFIVVAAAAANLSSSALGSDLSALAAGVLAAVASVLGAGRLRWRILNPAIEALSADSGCAGLESAPP